MRMSRSVSRPSRLPFHFIERTVADTAEQRPGVFIANLPVPHDVEKGFEAGERQSIARGAGAQVDRRFERVTRHRIPEGVGHQWLLFRSIFTLMAASQTPPGGPVNPGRGVA